MLHRLFRPRRIHSAAFAFFLLVLSAAAADAQALQGRVALQETGIAGVAVELHRVTRENAGVVAHTVTDASGHFRVPLPPPDTTGFTVWFATAEYQGVRYFGAPLHPGDSPQGYTITVFDTLTVAEAGSPVRVVRRDVVLLPDPTGSWEVNEIIQIHNPTDRSLVAAEGTPTWEFRIPAEATAFEAGETESSSAEIVRMDDRVLLVAPVLPGSREIYLRYRMPSTSSELRIAIGSPTDALGVFVGQPAPSVSVEGLAQEEPMQAEGRVFLRYEATNLAPGASFAVLWTPTGPPVDPRVAALAVVAVLLVIGAVAALRRGNGGRSQPRGTVAVPAVVRERKAPAELVS